MNVVNLELGRLPILPLSRTEDIRFIAPEKSGCCVLLSNQS